MGLNSYSEFNSRSSDQYSPWGSIFKQNPARTSSLIEGVSKDMDAVMQEFRMNGSDSPYDPEEEILSHGRGLTGMGPASAYLRQKSWPAPDSSPAVRLPRAQSWGAAADLLSSTTDQGARTPLSSLAPGAVTPHTVTPGAVTPLAVTPGAVTPGVVTPGAVTPGEPGVTSGITEQQMRVLRSLPNAVLYPLLRELERARRQEPRPEPPTEQECRFCKNNGERAAYYRSHALRRGGRVACPVLRAFVCRRCGARGDAAHTLKYCPLTSAEERTKSAAMMRSLRTASGRRRQAPSSDMQDFVMFGETTPSVIADGNAVNGYESLPLDPIWAALEQKLML